MSFPPTPRRTSQCATRDSNRRETMRASRIALAATIALALFVPQAVAEEVEEASTELAQEPAAPAGSEASIPVPDTEASQAAEAEPVADGRKVELGPVGVDPQGRAGRIHVVSPGDTLWDISDAYLGTPWVWPSVWQDNQGIENPHLIFPADKIWITAKEMRKISEEEAAKLQSAALPGEQVLPASMEDASLVPERRVPSDLSLLGGRCLRLRHSE